MAVSSDLDFGTGSISRPNNAINLSVGSNYQSIINGAPEGATFWFEPGVHRFTSAIEPKDGQTFLGANGAVISGSRELTNFSTEGGLHVASGQTQEGLRIGTEFGLAGTDRAGYPETLFIDGKPLTPVDNVNDVEAGKFYFDYGANKIYFADNPSGHKVEAGYASAAFDSDASGVTISNLVIEQFDSPTKHGAIQGGEDWTVTHNEVRLNYGAGITVQDGSTVSGNYVHDNGQLGIGGNGSDVTVSENEIASNGHWSGISPYWEGGGTKFAATTNLMVTDNYSHDNRGLGLWTDLNNINTTYSGNLVVDNDGGGISHELSYDAKIFDNTSIGNGEALKDGGWLWGAQIQVQNSNNVEIYDNNVDMSGGLNGIALIQQDRGNGDYGPHTTTDNYVHDNIIVSTGGDGLTGGVADYNENGMLDNNTLADNHYYMSDGDHWRWGDFPSGDDWDAYVSDSGQDDGATLQSSNAIDTSDWLEGDAVSRPSVGTDDVVAGNNGGNTSSGTINGSNSAEALDGTSGDDIIFGNGGRDTIFGGQGNDVLHGGADSDIFVFEVRDGNDTIADFDHSGSTRDLIVLPDDYFRSGQDILAAAHNVGNDTVIDYGNNHLTIQNVHVSDLHASDFAIL